MNQRYYSLDVFRGATVALMILVNNPGSWEHIYAPLKHAPWHGCTPTDLVFPFFLFAVGNAMAFVIPKMEEKGTTYFISKLFKRASLIFLIGLFLNWSPFVMWQNDHLVLKGWEWVTGDGAVHGIRILGVLQRIALCYLFAGLIIYFLKPKGAAIASVIILLLYWWLCKFFGDAAGPYSMNGYFGVALDKAVLAEPHMYHGEGVAFDPEGLASTLAAIVQVIFGYFAGWYIRQKGKTSTMLKGLLVAGIICIGIGLLWSLAFPINKKIWTSSYVVYTSGLAVCVLAVFIYIIEFINLRAVWSRFFDVFGKNPLFIFCLSGFLPRVLGLISISNGVSADGKPMYLSPFGWFYEHICKNISADLRNGSLLYAICMLVFYWVIAWWLNKKKIYIKV